VLENQQLPAILQATVDFPTPPLQLDIPKQVLIFIY